MAKYKAAIVGVGYTEYSRNSGRSELSLAVEACQHAMEDAGLGLQDVDGLLSFSMVYSHPTDAVATALALPEVNYAIDWRGGGFAPSALVGTAAALIDCGMAKSVLIYRALNGRSGLRPGGGSKDIKITDVITPTGSGQYRMPYGWLTYTENMAIWCRRHMEKYGTKSEHLAAIAISQRENAILNERAMLRKPLTLEIYMAAPFIMEPFRMYDMCLETDGGCAVLLTSADIAKSCRKKPVFIEAAAYFQATGTGDPGYCDPYIWDDITQNFTTFLAPKLYKQADLGPNDIDVAEIYDGYSHVVLMGLEGLGFCQKGEGGPFAASGAIGLRGSIPVNTNGGFLSEGYIHGMNTIVEAVEQLRGESGARQVVDAEVAIAISGISTMGSGLILSV